MIEYQLKDGDGNLFPLNGATVTREFKDTWTQGDDEYSFDNKILERSNLPGSVLVGNPRIEGRGISLSVKAASSDSQVFRGEVNQLLEFVARTRYLVDVTNDMQIAVIVSDASVSYESGSLKLMATNQLEFVALNPYWESLTPDEVTGTALADTIKQVAIDNQGYLTSPPVITLVAVGVINSIQFTIVSNNIGIQIDDVLFGTTGNLTMAVNCETGEVSVGAINRNASIVESTGFFDLPIGADTLNILAADEDVGYTITFKKRYFV